MKRSVLFSLAAAGLLLGLFLLPVAPTASALFDCADCSPSAHPGERCIGVCNGVGTFSCVEYFAAGCGSLTAPPEESKEAFLASLREQAPASIEPLPSNLNQETGS